MRKCPIVATIVGPVAIRLNRMNFCSCSVRRRPSTYKIARMYTVRYCLSVYRTVYYLVKQVITGKGSNDESCRVYSSQH